MPAIHLFRALTATFVLLSIVLLPGRALAEADDLPRYDLPVGRVLSYSHETHSKNADGSPVPGSRGTVRATVLAANADGSRRVVLRLAYTYGDMPEEVIVGAVDVFPDGRGKAVGRPKQLVSASSVFPPMPRNAAEAAAEWQSPVSWDGTVMTYSAAPSPAGDVFVANAVYGGLTSRIYAFTMKSTIRFDRGKGVMTGSENESADPNGSEQTSTGKQTLDKDEMIDPARAAELAADYGSFFEADEKHGKLMTRISEEPSHAAKLAEEAKAVLITAMKGVEEPEVMQAFERKLKQHEVNARYDVEDAARIAGLLDKPAADWEANDLDGKIWRQADLKGKVVVIDFWYRGCAWCMYAMPQVKQLAADYKDKPVVVLGMNTDREEGDARFVVKELGLDYPQIKAEGLPERFGVESFPTLIIIDQEGVVRGFHSGYSADLREKIARRIDELLQK